MRSRCPLTEAAVLFVAFAVAATLVAVAGASVSVIGGNLGVLELGLTFAATCAYFALGHLRRARRTGWRQEPGEDERGSGGDDFRGGGDDPPDPPPPLPGGEPVDWDRFTADFWTHVEAVTPATVG